MASDSWLPDEWYDDSKMNIFFSPTRNSKVHLHEKNQFWENLIIKRCSLLKCAVFDSNTLQNWFLRKNSAPKCLGSIIEKMIKDGSLKRKSDFLTSSNSGWLSWSLSTFVAQPIKWTLNSLIKPSLSWGWKTIFGAPKEGWEVGPDGYLRMTSLDKPDPMPEGEFICIQAAREIADSIYSKHCKTISYEVTDNITAYDSLSQQSIHQSLCADTVTFDIAIADLCQRKLCRVEKHSDGEKLIIFVSSKGISKTLSGNEMKIHKLKLTENKLELDIQKIENEIEGLRQNAKQLVHEGKKTSALKCLKRKKLLEGALNQKVKTIDKIESLIVAIQQAASQKDILDAFSCGVEAFKGMQTASGLTEGKIDETMLDIQEIFDASEDINAAVSKPIVDNANLNQADLEDELEELLKGYKDEELDFDIFSMPSVPTHDPSVAPPRKTTANNLQNKQFL